VLEVMQLDGVRFKKYVLQNRFTGIIVEGRRFWTIRGAQRRAYRNLNRVRLAPISFNTSKGK
jgi:hypothetical protein